tara:strand:+ start:1286 stop:1468 length:183 start_codon:yes stop_codon:yes gene_type:complete
LQVAIGDGNYTLNMNNIIIGDRMKRYEVVTEEKEKYGMKVTVIRFKRYRPIAKYDPFSMF